MKESYEFPVVPERCKSYGGKDEDFDDSDVVGFSTTLLLPVYVFVLPSVVTEGLESVFFSNESVNRPVLSLENPYFIPSSAGPVSRIRRRSRRWLGDAA